MAERGVKEGERKMKKEGRVKEGDEGKKGWCIWGCCCCCCCCCHTVFADLRTGEVAFFFAFAFAFSFLFPFSDVFPPETAGRVDDDWDLDVQRHRGNERQCGVCSRARNGVGYAKGDTTHD